MLKINLKTRISFGLVVLVGFCAAATSTKPDKTIYHNLKVLPEGYQFKGSPGYHGG